MVSAQVVILEYACPAMGTIMANLMFSAPYRDLKRAIERGHLGDLNPTPWAFMLGNCFGWVTYGILLQNYWIFFANCPGFILSIWLNLGAVKLVYQGHHSKQMRQSFTAYLTIQEEERTSMSMSMAMSKSKSKRELLTQNKNIGPSTIDKDNGNSNDNDEERNHKRLSDANINDKFDDQFNDNNNSTTTTNNNNNVVTDWAKLVWNVTSQTTPAPAPHEKMVMGIVIVWTICASLICLARSLFASRTRELIVGSLVNLNLVFFYGAPLSTIWTVLSQGNSMSIHVPTMITNTLNGSFWTAYGIAVNDPFMYAPNGLGAALGGLQIALILIFPRRRIHNNNNRNRNSNSNNDAATTTEDHPSRKVVVGGGGGGGEEGNKYNIMNKAPAAGLVESQKSEPTVEPLAISDSDSGEPDCLEKQNIK